MNELAMAAVALVSLLVLGIVATRALSARVDVVRRVSPTALHLGQQGTVQVAVHNRGRLPTAGLRVHDRASSALVATSRFATAPLRRGESVGLRYGVTAQRRGRFQVGPALIELRDPFGVARRVVAAGGADEIVVYPRVVRLTGGPPLAGHLSSGSEGSPRPGPSSDELATIRDYIHGDDLRHVHWRSTAHRGRLMVRQHESRQHAEAALVLDRRASASTTSSFETMITTAASVMWRLQHDQFRARLVDGPIPGQAADASWTQTMHRLAVAEPADVDTATMWRQLERGAAGEGSLIAVVPAPDAAALRTMVRAGRTFGARVALLVRGHGHDHLEPAAAAAALRTAGWYAAVIEHEDDLAACWSEVAAAGGQRRRKVRP